MVDGGRSFSQDSFESFERNIVCFEIWMHPPPGRRFPVHLFRAPERRASGRYISAHCYQASGNVTRLCMEYPFWAVPGLTA